METALTPLEFMRRARRLLRRTRGGRRRRPCGSPTRSSSIAATAGRRRLQRLGVKQGDRVAYIAPNTHAQLESFYAVPQIGAVLVPDQLPPHRRRLRVHHRAQRRDDRVRRTRVPRRRRLAFARASRGHPLRRARGAPRRTGWLDYESGARRGRARRHAHRRSSGPPSPRPTCSPSITRAAPPRAPRA